MLTPKQGKTLVKLARNSITNFFERKNTEIEEHHKLMFKDRQGVFVTLHENGELRGCIGFPEPVYPLWQGVIRAARAAAFEDNRFTSLTKEELNEIQIEVSVLTVPEKINVKKYEDYIKEILIPRDGLIIRKGYNSGLLLPQVAPEQGWNSLELLEHTCLKAGLGKDEWKKSGTEIYRFQAQIFTETETREIVEQ